MGCQKRDGSPRALVLRTGQRLKLRLPHGGGNVETRCETSMDLTEDLTGFIVGDRSQRSNHVACAGSEETTAETHGEGLGRLGHSQGLARAEHDHRP